MATPAALLPTAMLWKTTRKGHISHMIISKLATIVALFMSLPNFLLLLLYCAARDRKLGRGLGTLLLQQHLVCIPATSQLLPIHN